ncbi:hypothetical protein [Labilithrix luteola]|uniref:hypothetical protein n=1 Tax=Labilithrix luteola TaxID=1391654 RepID=UPI0011BA8273|nr:hypothetical protein [Labilithrix luteola]
MIGVADLEDGEPANETEDEAPNPMADGFWATLRAGSKHAHAFIPGVYKGALCGRPGVPHVISVVVPGVTNAPECKDCRSEWVDELGRRLKRNVFPHLFPAKPTSPHPRKRDLVTLAASPEKRGFVMKADPEWFGGHYEVRWVDGSESTLRNGELVVINATRWEKRQLANEMMRALRERREAEEKAPKPTRPKVVRLRSGPAAQTSTMTVDELKSHIERLGGVRAVARAAIVDDKTIRRYLEGRGIPQEVSDALRSAAKQNRSKR